MTTHVTTPKRTLILAADPFAAGVISALRRVLGEAGQNTCAVERVVSPGDALRLIHRLAPGVAVVCLGRERLAESAPLIEAIRARRPRLPLVAITTEHEESVERAARTAGAGYYFALDEAADATLLRSTLEALGASRGPDEPDLPPPRIRGRPRRALESS